MRKLTLLLSVFMLGYSIHAAAIGGHRKKKAKRVLVINEEMKTAVPVTVEKPVDVTVNNSKDLNVNVTNRTLDVNIKNCGDCGQRQKIWKTAVLNGNNQSVEIKNAVVTCILANGSSHVATITPKGAFAIPIYKQNQFEKTTFDGELFTNEGMTFTITNNATSVLITYYTEK